jgi:glycosyltransferase involved in cell wall biosynthesis
VRRASRAMSRAFSSRRRAAHRVAPPAAMLELARRGPAPLLNGPPPAGARLRIATVIPSFRRGSGGHGTIVRLLGALKDIGHEVTVWLEDSESWHAAEGPQRTAAKFREFFGAGELALHSGFGDWEGADVVVATGWQTVARVLTLDRAHARAYLVQDHEPDFYPASAESLWAAQTYRAGIHCVAASPWLADLLRTRYDASASHFDLAVDHAIYSPGAHAPRADHVAFYSRASTPRRAVPLGLAALEELARRRPAVDVALFGDPNGLDTGFAHRDLGVLDDGQLAALYREASVGLVLSLTNPSLVCLEMMACGLPCVELASESMLTTFGGESPLRLSKADPLALAGAIEELLLDPARRRSMSEAGVALMAKRTWSGAAQQVADGFMVALERAPATDEQPRRPR